MRKFSKILAIVMVISMIAVFFAGCGDDKPTDATTTTTEAPSELVTLKNDAEIPAEVNFDDFKIGFIFLHDENSTYDKNFMDAAKAAQAKLGLKDDQVIFKVGIGEDESCLNAASELVAAGCDVIFADSFGHESYMIQAAKEFTNVQFCHATGTNALTAGLANYHNAFASIYEGRYLAGIAAGVKLNEMISEGKITADKAKMGYVGAHPYAEVISGLSSFYLGAKSVCPSVTMDVKYTGSWFDIAKEKETAQALIASGCVLISQHADSEGAPKACEEAGVPNVGYNISTINLGPKTALISSKISWEPYFELIMKCTAAGKAIPTDWCGTIATGSVQLTELNAAAYTDGGVAAKAAIEAAQAKLEAGTLHVFDVSTFTVGGNTLSDGETADVISDSKFTPDTKVVKDGYFQESTARSAPYFFMTIDGLTGVIP
ncbi:MAG: BMP family ABC transporter substrate-binding protein, partial [Leucobacter sp.]|nr:BMP family ABC transporter substrate-binding protein [Leucobacter sp.]